MSMQRDDILELMESNNGMKTDNRSGRSKLIEKSGSLKTVLASENILSGSSNTTNSFDNKTMTITLN